MKVTSVRGEVLDVGKFLAENADQIAIGNAKMNARGDIVGPGGKVVKKREEISAEYHRGNPKAVKKVALKNLAQEVLSPTEALEDLKRQAEAQQAAKEESAAPKSRRKISDSE